MDQQTQIQQTIIDELGLTDLPQDKQEQLLIKMTEVLLKRIFLETMEKLDEKGREEYQRMIEGGADAQQVEQFLTSQISEYQQVVEKVIADFKEEMKGDFNN